MFKFEGLIYLRSLYFNKIKVLLTIFLGVIFVTAIYIACSTIYINGDMYRKVAWDYVKHDKTIINWNNGSVEKIELPSDRYLINPHKQSGNINRVLLNLNGNQAVKVTFNTELDALLGPSIIYINPFTKQVIGLDDRE